MLQILLSTMLQYVYLVQCLDVYAKILHNLTMYFNTCPNMNKNSMLALIEHQLKGVA